MNFPEPEYRQSLRESAARMAQVEARVHELTLRLQGQVVTATTGPEWGPLPALPTLEGRLVTGAVVLDVRGPDGLQAQQVQVAEGVYLLVQRGCLALRRTQTEPDWTEYGAGAWIILAPGEVHTWQLRGDTAYRAVLLPANTFTTEP